MTLHEYVLNGGSLLDLHFEHREQQGDLIVEWSERPAVARCSRCAKVLPAACFGRDRRRTTGLQPACRACENQRRRDRYATDADYRQRKIDRLEADRRAAGAQPQRRVTPEQRRANRSASNRAWNEANPERRRELARQWREANPERRQELKRADYRRNREKYIKRAVRRTQALRAADRRVILEREFRRLYASPCASCGTRERIEADHIIPIARGGRHSIGNLQPLCRACNRSKWTWLLIEWKAKR